jgi:hypothetical protein
MRHDNPVLTDSGGNRIVPRTLLQEEIITSATGDVVLSLPATPWKRFEVQIDDWAPTSNAVTPVFQLGVAGGIKAGASDYQLHVGVSASNAQEIADYTDTNSNVFMTRNDVNYKAGNGLGESLSYSVVIAPGSSDSDLPMAWFSGAGIGDAGRMIGMTGFGAYRGTTSGVFGRADEIRFAFDSNTIDRGIFRLYGTE